MTRPVGPAAPVAAVSSRREPLRPFKLFGVFFRVGALNELQYRANLAVQVFQSVIALVTGLVVLALVFGQTANLGGWTQSELLAVMGVHILMGGIIGAAVQPNMERLMTDVRQGTLDFILTKPEDSQVLISVREFRIWRLVDVVIGAIVLTVAIVQIQGSLGLGPALAFAFALLIGAAMIYCFWLILTTAAFWIVRMDEIHELLDGDLPVGALAGHDLPGLAADLADVPRPDRVRGDGPGRGAHGAADARDAGDRGGLRLGAGADLAVVVAVRAEALRGRLGLSEDIRHRLNGRYASRTMSDRELSLPPGNRDGADRPYRATARRPARPGVPGLVRPR